MSDVTPDAMTHEQALQEWTTLGRLGFVVSVCYGPIGLGPAAWTVNVLSPTGREFDRPYRATSLEHALALAALEVAFWLGMMPNGFRSRASA